LLARWEAGYLDAADAARLWDAASAAGLLGIGCC